VGGRAGLRASGRGIVTASPLQLQFKLYTGPQPNDGLPKRGGYKRARPADMDWQYLEAIWNEADHLPDPISFWFLASVPPAIDSFSFPFKHSHLSCCR
jgi:hypothetical protein